MNEEGRVFVRGMLATLSRRDDLDDTELWALWTYVRAWLGNPNPSCTYDMVTGMPSYENPLSRKEFSCYTGREIAGCTVRP